MVAFEITDKVALITGGASGLGFQYALGLLEKGARGVTLADVNSEVGTKAVQEIETKYGKGKAIFVKTDVTSYEEFEDAFKKTIETFKNVDILINNAGILNDVIWQKEIAINVNGTIHGILLGLDNYLPKYRSGPEALIVNISSISGIGPTACIPVYVGTKFAVHGMTLSWGQPAHFDRTKVRVVGVCPGVTITPLITLTEVEERTLYEDIRKAKVEGEYLEQQPEEVVPFVMQIIEKAPSATMWVVELGQPPYKYEMPNRLEIPKVYLQ